MGFPPMLSQDYYVLAIPQYKYNILVIIQVQAKQ